MRKNALREKFKTATPVVNGWLHIPSTVSAEAMAHQGFDSLTLDLQHGLIDYSSALPMLQAISTTDVVPMVRVPWNEPGIIMKCLDAGAYGVICPMVNTQEECEAFVGACRYPPAPHGYRSSGPTRAKLYGGNDYGDHANDEILTLAMIETAQALENIDAIMSVEGLDGVYVGPSDLGQSMGHGTGLDRQEPVMLEAINHIAASAKKHGIVAGIHTGDPKYASERLANGFNYITIGSDFGLMNAAAKQAVNAVRAGEGMDLEASAY